jgi:hypothetical protein
MGSVDNSKTATILIGEDDREMRSLLCEAFCGTGLCCLKRGMETKPFWLYYNLHRI